VAELLDPDESIDERLLAAAHMDPDLVNVPGMTK
jgi:hypothetical protein